MYTQPIPLDEALTIEQDYLPLSPRFADFLGKLPVQSGFSFLIFGGAGSAKSSLCLQLAGEMERFGNVLYVCAEEAIANGTIQLRARQLGITSGDIDLLDETELDDIVRTLRRGDYSYCFIDSITTITDGDKKADPRKVIRLNKLFPDIGFFFVSQATKGRTQHAGAASLEHDVDASILVSGQGVEARFASIHKSRFGATVHQIPVFLPTNNNEQTFTPIIGEIPMTTTSPLQLTGGQLKKLRRLHDISQDALAKRSGVDRRKISMMETSDSQLPETLVGALYGLCPHCADSVKELRHSPQPAQNLTDKMPPPQSFPGQSAMLPHGAASNADASKLFYYEHRCADLTAEVQVLKAQNGDLQRRLDEAEDDVHELEKLLSQIQTKTSLNDKFDELKRTADNALKKEEMNAELLGLAMTHAPAIVNSLVDGFQRLRGGASARVNVSPASPRPFEEGMHHSAPKPFTPTFMHSAEAPKTATKNADDIFIRTSTEE